MRVVPEFPERLGLRRRGQLLISFGKELPGQVGGLVFGDAQVYGVDLPGPQRREGDRQPGGDGTGVDDLAGRGLPGQVQVRGQRLGRELPHLRPARQARHRRGRITGIEAPGTAAATGRGTAGAGWGVAGRRGSGRVANSRIAVISAQAANDPIRRIAAITPIRSSSGKVARILLVGGGGVHQGGQDRARVHLLRGAVLAEPGPARCPRRSAPPPRPPRPSAPRDRPRCLLLIPGLREPGGLGRLRGAVVPARRRAGCRTASRAGSGTSGSGSGNGAEDMNHLSFGRKEEGELENKDTIFRDYVLVFNETFFDGRMLEKSLAPNVSG